MSDHVTLLQPAYVLHSRPYRESSLILDVLTKDLGKVALIAKSIRKNNSNLSALLQPFVPLLVSFTGRSQLQTLTHVEQINTAIGLEGVALYCGYYLNELIMHFLKVHDPHPEVFQEYSICLNYLERNPVNVETGLRLFEINLLESIGYALQLSYDFESEKPIDPKNKYHYIPEYGPKVSINGAISGKTINAIKLKKLENTQILVETKLLLRQVIEFHLQGKTLKTRTLINKIYQK